MPSPSWDVSVAWLCLCPIALLTDLFALAVVFHFRPLLHSVDVALASLLVTMASHVCLLLPFPAVIRLAGDLRWTKDTCTFYNWLASTLRASNVLVLMLLNIYWVSSLRTSPEPTSPSHRPGRMFSSSKIMKLAVSITWVIAVIVGLVPVAGETKVFDYYEQTFSGSRCWFLPYNTDIGYALFFIIVSLACLFIGMISSGDTLLLFRQMRRYALTKYNTTRRSNLPGHVTGVAQSEEDTPSAHAQHCELSVSVELCLLGFCVTLCSAAVNALPLVVSQFIQLAQVDYDRVAMETVLLWLLLAESLVLPHLLWALSGRYRHAVRYLWRVYFLRDPTAKEEDAAACTLQAFRMKAKEWSVRAHNNGSAPKQINGDASHTNIRDANLSADPRPSGKHEGNGGDHTVKVTSVANTSPAPFSNNSTTDLDDGMTAVASLPCRSGAVQLRNLGAYATTSENDPKTGVNDATFVIVQVARDDKLESLELESSMNEDMYENTRLSPPAVWASRIVPRKGFEHAGASGATSQSTPNTPTKSLGVSPNPPSRRAGSTSSSGSSSYSRVKRSASATSRQEWKERMRKKHLPAIFINTSFEEDGTDPATIAQNNAYSHSNLSNTSLSSNDNVIEELDNKDTVIVVGSSSEKMHGAQQDPEEKPISSKKSYKAPSVPKNPSVESTYYFSSNYHHDYLNTLSAAPPLSKQNTMESEGMSGMYEDGDIGDVLDSSGINEAAPLDFASTQSKRKFSLTGVAVQVHELPSEALLTSLKEDRHRKQNVKIELEDHPSRAQGVENKAFDFGNESSLPGSAEDGIFYDDTVISPATFTTSIVTSTSSTPTNPGHSSILLLSDNIIIEEVSAEKHSNSRSSSANLLRDRTTLPTDASQTHSASDPLLVNVTTSSTTTSSSSTVSQLRRAKYRQSVASSDLLVSSVDKFDTVIKGGDNEDSAIENCDEILGNSSNKGMEQQSRDEATHNFPEASGLVVEGIVGEQQAHLTVDPVKASQESAAQELTSVSQDWSQLETVSGSEMLLLKTQSVRTAAQVMLESSIEEEDEDDEAKQRGENTDEGGEKEDFSDGGTRVDEEEWRKMTPNNLASFSTRENLHEVGQIEYNIGTFTPESSPPPFERDGNGDGAESVPNIQHSTSLKSLAQAQSGEDISGVSNNANSSRTLPNLKALRAQNVPGKNSFLRKSFEALSQSPEYKSYIAENADGKNSFFISQDSISDSVFESSIDTNKDLSMENGNNAQVDIKDNATVVSVDSSTTTHEKPSLSVFEKSSPTGLKTVPEPVLSVTPALPPTHKPPRSARRGNRRDEEVYARLTSSEDELDGIFVKDQRYDALTRASLGADSPSTESNDNIITGVEAGEKSFNINSTLVDLHAQKDLDCDSNGKAFCTKNAPSWNPFDHYDSEKTTIAVKSKSSNNTLESVHTFNERKEPTVGSEHIENDFDEPTDLSESQASHSSSVSDKSEHSVVLEPYGERRPQWLDDDDLSFQRTSSPWMDGDNHFPVSQNQQQSFLEPRLRHGTENIIYFSRAFPDESTTDFDDRNGEPLQASTDFRFTESGETALADVPSLYSAGNNATKFHREPRLEEYDFDSVNIGDQSHIGKRLYQKNPRPSSSRPLRAYHQVQPNSAQLSHHPLPPPYAADHLYQAPDLQPSQPAPLVQYHFDEDIDRGFEEALSIDYLPLAHPPLPPHMNTLYAPATSLGLYFESITEEPEDSLSLTEIAEASSLNGDNIFKTQAIVSRPSSRASFAASTENEQPDDNPIIQTKSAEVSERSDTLGITSPHLTPAYRSDDPTYSPEYEEHASWTTDLMPTSERTSADGSEAVGSPVGNGNHNSNYSSRLHSTMAVSNGNPWVFSEHTSDINKDPKDNAFGLDTFGSQQNSASYAFSMDESFVPPVTVPNDYIKTGDNSAWLELDLTIKREGDTDGENQLDMSFDSDFSSDNALANSLGREDNEISDWDDFHHKQGFDTVIRNSQGKSKKESSSLTAVGDTDVEDKAVKASASDHGENVSAVYF